MVRRLEIEPVEVDGVTIPEGRRAVNEKTVAQLAESMKRLGLRTPIGVRYVPIAHDPETNRPIDHDCVLVVGRHRLAAAAKLGWRVIDTVDLSDLSDTDAELWEIDENLCRSELTAAEQAECLVKRKRLFDAKVGQVVQPSGQKAKFAKATEQATGIDQRTINRAVARGEKIAPEVLAEVKGTEDDKGTVLDRLTKVSGGDAQRAELSRIQQERAERKRATHAADHAAREDASEQLALLLSEHIPVEHHASLLAWLGAAKLPEVIKAFRAINGAVFDKTNAARAA